MYNSWSLGLVNGERVSLEFPPHGVGLPPAWRVEIGIISDTHGLVRPEVYEAFEGVDLILHAGDIGSLDVIIELEPVAPVRAVVGNIDVDLGQRFKKKCPLKLKGGPFIFSISFKIYLKNKRPFLNWERAKHLPLT